MLRRVACVSFERAPQTQYSRRRILVCHTFVYRAFSALGSVFGDDQEITACQERSATDYNAMLFTEEREIGGIDVHALTEVTLKGLCEMALCGSGEAYIAPHQHRQPGAPSRD